ncbi:26.2 kDa heat shock protein, mitochondrial-like [Cornus florida]|uniref:26.2 kDa heat shock protein, mitochondrial-like n=1 Tax=Cornus florida TaxID=4283 RepID=UPI00289BC709|nr:26.2 kDa heat shock protein, mitochondrial-like [Cornus florida]
MASSRSLISTLSLMRRLSPLNLNTSPVLIRSFSKSTHPETSSESHSKSDSDTPTDGSEPSRKMCPLVNRFLKEGPPQPYSELRDDDALYARLDMPGIGKGGLKMWVEDNSLQIKGEEEVDEMDGDDPLVAPRRYSGDIDLPRNAYKVDEIDAALNNGVLMIKIPKIKLEDRKDVFTVNVK